jgi:AcrR family transcriptional regulator
MLTDLQDNRTPTEAAVTAVSRRRRLITNLRDSRTLDPIPDEESLERIRAAADELFYRQGILATSVDEVATAAGVSVRLMTTLGQTEQTLVAAYLAGRHERARRIYESARARADTPRGIVCQVLSEIAAQIALPEFRGCAFINAAAEFPDDKALVRVAVREHREWYVATATLVLREAGHPLPGEAADELLIARDGAMITAYGSGDVTSALTALRRVTDRILDEVPLEAA